MRVRAAAAVCTFAITIASSAEAITDASLSTGPSSTVALTRCDAEVVVCSGVLVAPDVVLTAAHCVDRPTGYRIFVGEDTARGVELDVATIRVHPDYEEGRVEADLALLFLSEEVEASLAQPATLADLEPAIDASVTLVGYGRTAGDLEDFGTRRTGTATVTAVSNGVIEMAPGPSLPCDVDSGGAVLGEVNGEEVLIGIVSAGDVACEQWGSAAHIAASRVSFIEPAIAAREEAALSAVCEGGQGEGGSTNDDGCSVSGAGTGSSHWVIAMALGLWSLRRRGRGGPALLAVVAFGSGCGAKTGLDVFDGSGGAPGEGGSGAGVIEGGGGSSPFCPVTAFAGDRSGGVRLVMDDTYAYWTTTLGDIERGDLTTGEVATIASFGEERPAALGLSNRQIYVATDSGLFSVGTAGGEVIALAPAAWRPVGLAAIGDSVVVLHYGGGVLDGAVYEFSPGAGLRMLFQGLDFPSSITADATHAYAAASGVRLGDEFILEGVIVRVDRATGEAAIAVGDLEDPFDVELSGDSIIAGEWLNRELTIDARLFRAPKPGGVAELVGRISTEALPVAMALDETSAYISLPFFTTGSSEANSQLVAVPLSGGDAQVTIDLMPGFFTEPATNTTHVAISVQPRTTGESVEANVLVRCK